MCKVCGCSFKNDETCLWCAQNHEYQQSPLADCVKRATGKELELEEEELHSENFVSPVSLHVMKSCIWPIFRMPLVVKLCKTVLLHQVYYVMRETLLPVTKLSAQETATPSSVLHEEGNSCPGPSRMQKDCGVMSLTVHCSVICSDMIEHFRDTRVMHSLLLFTIINERGNKEEGVGVGVERGVFIVLETICQLDDNQRMTKSYFHKAWSLHQGMGSSWQNTYQRIPISLIFPFVPIKSIHLLFFVWCWSSWKYPFGIHHEVFVTCARRLVKEYQEKACLPDDNDELLEFFERLNCRSAVSDSEASRYGFHLAA